MKDYPEFAFLPSYYMYINAGVRDVYCWPVHPAFAAGALVSSLVGAVTCRGERGPEPETIEKMTQKLRKTYLSQAQKLHDGRGNHDFIVRLSKDQENIEFQKLGKNAVGWTKAYIHDDDMTRVYFSTSQMRDKFITMLIAEFVKKNCASINGLEKEVANAFLPVTKHLLLNLPASEYAKDQGSFQIQGWLGSPFFTSPRLRRGRMAKFLRVFWNGEGKKIRTKRGKEEFPFGFLNRPGCPSFYEIIRGNSGAWPDWLPEVLGNISTLPRVTRAWYLQRVSSTYYKHFRHQLYNEDAS